eukprot:6571936-Pyramimonas_sp.AAC.1
MASGAAMAPASSLMSVLDILSGRVHLGRRTMESPLSPGSEPFGRKTTRLRLVATGNSDTSSVNSVRYTSDRRREASGTSQTPCGIPSSPGKL